MAPISPLDGLPLSSAPRNLETTLFVLPAIVKFVGREVKHELEKTLPKTGILPRGLMSGSAAIGLAKPQKSILQRLIFLLTPGAIWL